MPAWTVSPEWQGQDVFILGGGSSLKDFDFSILKGRNVIGCNAAHRLGEDIVSICFFGDNGFFQRNRSELESFKNRVVTCSPSLARFDYPFLLQLGRIREGLGSPRILGWNFSTGAAAISLAFHLGARRIFLLGFDMNLGEAGKSHWHSAYPGITAPHTFARHLKGLEIVACCLKALEDPPPVLNVTDGTSAVQCFQKVSFEDFKNLYVGH